MIDLLDNTLTMVIGAAPAGGLLDDLHNADVSFITPEKGHAPAANAEVNLFLYETKENRNLRDPLPMTVLSGGLMVRRRPPLRVDCAYMVTAWCDGATPGEKVNAAHKLLGQALNWLSRFPEIPDTYLQAGGLSTQLYAPPTMVAQLDGVDSAGEFWHALGIAPRPYFNLVVTIAMDLDLQIEDSIVTTITSRYHGTDPTAVDERVLIGGTVRDKLGVPVPDAWVRLDPVGMPQLLSETQVTDTSGRFIFSHATSGTTVALRARSPGLGQTPTLNFNIPSDSGDYDLQFT
jgi:hypothetical protein